MGGVHGAWLCSGLVHIVGSSQSVNVFQLYAGTLLVLVCLWGQSREFRSRLGEECFWAHSS